VHSKRALTLSRKQRKRSGMPPPLEFDPRLGVGTSSRTGRVILTLFAVLAFGAYCAWLMQ